MNEPDLQRWSREVAEDPGAPSFVRLARMYRKQDRRDAALNVVLRGLEQNPEHVEAHALLAILYVEEGDRESARDEWEMVLRLQPESFEARRGLGFLALERGDLEAARRYLDGAAALRSDDPAVAQARQVLARRESVASRRPGAPLPTPAHTGHPAVLTDPARLFEPLSREAPFLGALVLNGQGLVVAGSVQRHDRGEKLGALLSTAVAEARRAVEIMRLGRWDGLFLDCEESTLHLSPMDGGAVVILVARRDAPPGWVMRVAERALDLARRFMEPGS